MTSGSATEALPRASALPRPTSARRPFRVRDGEVLISDGRFTEGCRQTIRLPPASVQFVGKQLQVGHFQ